MLVRRLERETIARLQRLMVAWVAPSPPASPRPAELHAPVTVLFGHECLAPIENGRDGARVCRNLGGCLACPGLVVPLDAERFARVIQAQRHLLEARDRIDTQRWALFYAASLTVLEHDLLPTFPATLRRRAEALAKTLPPLADIE